MKKTIITTLLLAFLVTGLSAQVGVGARGLFGVDGNAYGGLEFSIQKLHKYELDIGTMNESWKATGLKLFPFVQRKNLGFYGGLGIGLGYYDPYDEAYATLAADIGGFIMIGRVQIGLDWRPEWNFVNYSGNDLGFNTAFSARWVFGRKN